MVSDPQHVNDVAPHVDGPIVVDVWSDIMCPFCYMGDTLLMQAAASSGRPVDVRYHSYQLMPDLPTDSAANVNEVLASKRGIPREQAEAMNAQVTERAAQLGLEYHLDHAQATNTKAAHRLIHFASSEGRGHEMTQRLFRAYFTEGRNLGDYAVLADLAVDAGLDRDRALAALESGAFGDAFDRDVAQAHELGIGGVPFFVFDGRYAVSGAQPVEVFAQALDAAASARQS